jgi:xanthine dehydrogenase accessory factor
MEPLAIYRKLIELSDAGVPFALALVLGTHGSTPQQPGAKALIEGTGRIWGTVGGGQVEAEARRLAIEACRSQRAVVFDFYASNDDAQRSGAICGGTMRILVDPTARKHRACYVQAVEALERRERGALTITIRGPEVGVEWQVGPACRAGPGDNFPGTETAPQEGPARQAGPTEVYFDPVVPPPLLVIAGGGHVGQAVARQAVEVGFDVRVIDDRPEFAAPALFPQGVVTRCGPIAVELASCPMGPDTYFVIVTRGHQQDAEALAACIRQPAQYIGMIGSRRKVALIRESFMAKGLATAEQFDRVFAPIGLDIGAVTVPEIATSIVAQLISVRRRARRGS